MKKRLKKNWLWIIVVVLLIAGGPIVINELYKVENGYITLWGAAEMLSYYGVLLAAIISIVGVYFTVYISNKNYREDAKNRIRPYIAINIINNVFDDFIVGFDNKGPVLLPDDNGEQECMTFVIDKKDDIRVNILTAAERSKANSTYVKWKRGEDGTIYIRDSEVVSMPFEIENVGNGTAINLHIGLAQYDSRPHFETDMTLKRDQTIFIYIFSEKKYDEIKGNYSFSIFYDDISGNHYVQKFPIRIFEDEKGRKYKNIDISGKQHLFEEDTTNADT